MKKNKALFISHADDNSGAPKALYNILKFMLISYKINIDVCVCVPKSIGIFENLKREEFINNIPNVFYLKINTQKKLIQKLIYFLDKKNHCDRTIKKYNKQYDFVFFNSISYNFYKSELDNITIPKYLYLHEGSNFLYTSLKGDYSIFNKFEHIFVPSELVEKDLLNNGIHQSKITVLQLFLDENEIINEHTSNSTIHRDEFVVGNLANLDWTKGIEYFLSTAKLYKELYPRDNIKFKWKGYVKDSFFHNLIKFEIQKAGLSNVVVFEEKSKEIKDFFSFIDVFLMTSKQETFGFVVLEAANYFKPSITFKEVVGAAAFINNYGGFTVEYLSIYQLVVCLKKYYEDRGLMKLHGIEANQYLIANYTLNENLRKELKNKLEIIFN